MFSIISHQVCEDFALSLSLAPRARMKGIEEEEKKSINACEHEVHACREGKTIFNVPLSQNPLI